MLKANFSSSEIHRGKWTDAARLSVDTTLDFVKVVQGQILR